MTVHLKKALEDLKQLSASEQDAIAKLIQEEIQWEQSAKKVGNKISKLAEDALKEHRSGKTKKGDW